MVDLLIRIIESYTASEGRMFEVNKLLAAAERKTGGEKFEINGGYKRFADSIDELCSEGMIAPVKNSGKNGMTPVLYSKYRIVKGKNISGQSFKDEILSLHPALKKDYYLSKIGKYENDREYILRLNEYLQKYGFSMIDSYRCTINERSFEIFNDEKYLEEKGKAMLKKLGLDIGRFNCYHAKEAFFYIVLKPGREGNALIIENKDTFVSLIRAISHEGSNIRNVNDINLLIYGEGNKITDSFEFMHELERENPVNKIFYFGDIDYPGIDIYQRLAKKFPEYDIIPHVRLYEQLVCSVDNPPAAKNAVQYDTGIFLVYFDNNLVGKISHVLEGRKYIPQEGLCFAKGGFEI